MEHMNLSKTVLGIELGSTRIKAVLLDECYIPIASGSYTWENQFIDGVWTYALSDAETGLQTCFAELKADFEQKYAELCCDICGTRESIWTSPPRNIGFA